MEAEEVAGLMDWLMKAKKPQMNIRHVQIKRKFCSQPWSHRNSQKSGSPSGGKVACFDFEMSNFSYLMPEMLMSLK